MTATFWITNEEVRQRAAASVANLPLGTGLMVVIQEEPRNLDQNARLHALLSDIVKIKPVWAGERMSVDDYKALFVHAVDKLGGRDAGRAVPGLEGGVVLLRRSTKSMNKRDMSEVISYAEYWMTKP